MVRSRAAAAVRSKRGNCDEIEANRALAAAWCVLAVSPADAISVTSHPWATTTSVPGAVLFADFGTIQNTAISTITGGVLNLGTDETIKSLGEGEH